MALNSIVFLLFLAASVTVYYLLPGRRRNAFLLLASYVFYLWKLPQYGVLLLAVTGMSYALARALAAQKDTKKKRALLTLSILACLSALLVFKYFNFFMDSLAALFSLCGLTLTSARLSLALPAGISFYTFTVVGYLVDVYHEKVEPERDFVTYALFVSFFPSVLMGPIARAGEMLPQYKTEHSFEYGNLVEGLQRFLTGAFKKIVVADGLGILVDGVYGKLADYRGAMLLCAVVLYAVQLYADFSGYTDMALGAAKLLGFSLRENFKAPYLATDVSGMWTRWHLSLTTWLTDYIFTPLVWSRWYDKLAHKKDWQQRAPSFWANILLVFLISGLWHGAGLTFILWGLANGAARCVEDALLRARKKSGRKKAKRREFGLVNNLGRLYVFVFWSLSLVLFRSATLADAGYVFKNLFAALPLSVFREQLLHLAAGGISTSRLYLALYFGCLAAGLLLLAVFDVRVYRSSLKGQTLCMNPLGQYATVPRWLLYWFMGLATAMFFLISRSGASTSSQFIYGGF